MSASTRKRSRPIKPQAAAMSAHTAAEERLLGKYQVLVSLQKAEAAAAPVAVVSEEDKRKRAAAVLQAEAAAIAVAALATLTGTVDPAATGAAVSATPATAAAPKRPTIRRKRPSADSDAGPVPALCRGRCAAVSHPLTPWQLAKRQCSEAESVASTDAPAILIQSTPTVDEELEMTKSTVFVGNLLTSVPYEILLEHFSSFGKIKTIRQMPGKTYCFVTYETPESADVAIRTMHQVYFGGNVLAVTKAKTSASISKQKGGETAGNTDDQTKPVPDASGLDASAAEPVEAEIGRVLVVYIELFV